MASGLFMRSDSSGKGTFARSDSLGKGAFARSDSLGKGALARSDSLGKGAFAGFARNESFVKNKVGGNSRRTVVVAMAMCTFAFVLLQHVWYAHVLVIRVGMEKFNSDPRTEEHFEVVTPLSLLQKHLQDSDSLVDLRAALSKTASTTFNILDKDFITAGLNPLITSSELGFENEVPIIENVEGINDGVEIGEETEPATESTKANAGDVKMGEGDASKVRIMLVVQELGQKQEPEEVISLRRNEVSSSAAYESKENHSNVTKVERKEMSEVIPRAIPRTWAPPKKCATAEEMGAATVGDTRAASLRLRVMIQRWIAEHGAERIRKLPAAEFCQKRFVLAQALEDGFGNNMYKVLTAAGVAVILNRSLIIAERAGMHPKWEIHPKQMPKRAFGDYLEFSNETFTVREVRKLWAIHGCETNYNRSLVVHTDTLDATFNQTRCICDDWTTLTTPVLEFRGATGAGAIQLLLKNAHPAMRAAAAKLLGSPALPDSRPNTFGELVRAFVSPNADIQAAVEWALQGGPDPDITLHLRMLHSASQPGLTAATSCINRIWHQISLKHPIRGRRPPRVVVVTDTPAMVAGLRRALQGHGVEMVRFDYREFARGNTRENSTLSLRYGLPSPKRVRDWGETPRWVAMVDFFLAARATAAVVSGASRRVSTTFSQLAAALAAANSLDCVYYSSFQPPLVASGLSQQSGWGFSWRPFGGKLGCRNQAAQCAKTALQPYTWWDAPWQSPIMDDVALLRNMAGVDSKGQVSEMAMDQYCTAIRKTEPQMTTVVIPSYEQAVAAD